MKSRIERAWQIAKAIVARAETAGTEDAVEILRALGFERTGKETEEVRYADLVSAAKGWRDATSDPERREAESVAARAGWLRRVAPVSARKIDPAAGRRAKRAYRRRLGVVRRRAIRDVQGRVVRRPCFLCGHIGAWYGAKMWARHRCPHGHACPAARAPAGAVGFNTSPCASCRREAARRRSEWYAATAREHAALDAKLGRYWQCACGACRAARADGYHPGQ